MGGRVYPDGTDRLTSREWEDLIITTALLLGWDEDVNPNYRTGDYWQHEKWRRASKWLWNEKGMHVRYNGTIFVQQGKYPDDGQSESNLHKPSSTGAVSTQSKVPFWHCD